MDSYGQIGPEKGDYDEDCDRVAEELNVHGVVGVKFAARLTVKHLVLASLDAIHNVGGRVEGFAGQPGLYVGIHDGRGAWLPADGMQHWGYVAQYLGQPFGDGEVDHPLADFVNRIAVRLGVLAAAE